MLGHRSRGSTASPRVSSGRSQRGSLAAPSGPASMRSRRRPTLRPLWGRAYTLALCAWAAGTMWAFAAVFGTTGAAIAAAPLPIPWTDAPGGCDVNEDPACLPHYRGWLLVFGLVVVPLSCLRMREQKWLQLALAVGRIVVMALMAITVLVAPTCPRAPFVQLEPGWQHTPRLLRGAGLAAARADLVVAGLLSHRGVRTRRSKLIRRGTQHLPK